MVSNKNNILHHIAHCFLESKPRANYIEKFMEKRKPLFSFKEIILYIYTILGNKK